MNAEDFAKEPPVVVYQFTEPMLREFVKEILKEMGPIRERKPFVRLAEAAELLGVSKDTVRRHIRAKIIQVLPKIGDDRISMDEIDRLNGLPGGVRKRRKAEVG